MMTIDDQGMQPEPVEAGVRPKKNRRPLIAIGIATAAVIGIGGLGTAAVAILTTPSTSATAAQSHSSTSTRPFWGRNGFGQQSQGQSGQSGLQGQGQQDTSTAAATPATAAEKVGVVTINTVLDYDTKSQAAGTGMILSSSGYILTNNHVVQGSTRISVTVESTNKTYTAVVVGTDATADVAVLKLVGASRLSTVSFASAEKVVVGQSIHSVGNAEGTGDLVTASGTVGGVDQSVTVGSDYSESGESLTGAIEVESDVVSGDSGGPLFDSSGKVIGMVTAASSGTTDVTGYALNIASVLRVVDQIESGRATSEVVIGYPAFLGVQIAQTSGIVGVPVGGAFAGMPAAEAGITEGSTITAVDGVAVTTPDQLSSLISGHHVGDAVTIVWTDATGVGHSSVVTLVAGPAE